MKKIITVDGNEACAKTSYMFTELAGIYPITPASPMAEHIDEWSNNGVLNIFNDKVKVVEMQSEAGAAGMVHGSLSVGTLSTTYTASQGLLLMIPNMYKMAGEMLPCVMHVAARSLSTHALSIMGDHQDIYATRMTGFCMLASSSVQDTSYLSGIAHLSAIESSLPFMHFFDGFRTSHEIQKIECLETDDYKNLINYDALNSFRNKSLNPLKPYTKGVAEGDSIYFQRMEVRNSFYDKVPDIVNNYMEKINELADTSYKPFNYYGDSNPDKVIIAMGSVCETIKETIDVINKNNYHVGLIEVHLYRPFSSKYLMNVLPKSVSKVAVLDRTKEAGSIGEPLYLDIKSALNDITVVGGRYGLSSKNVTPRDIKAVYDMLNNPKHNFTIGITDDITNLSLESDKSFKIINSNEILIYGYGSDGMVSASKSIIKLIGNNTNNYVQGYFEYDSKKSGGVTVSHLRFSDKVIRSTYYVENPKMVVVTKDSYLNEYDILDKIEDNGILIINTLKNEEELNSYISSNNKKEIITKNIKVYIINAYELARKLGLKNKISTIMESIIVEKSQLIDNDLAKEEFKKYAKNRYFKKGEEVLKANYNAIDEANNHLCEIKINNNYNSIIDIPDNVVKKIERRLGNNLKTSDFINMEDGMFPSATALKEKRMASDIVPMWINNNCIMCNQCSLYCPHGVIRPYLVSNEEYSILPSYIQKRAIKPLESSLKDYYYIIGISVKDCTGCGVCINICPGKKEQKALVFSKLDEMIKNKEQDIFDYLEANIEDKNIELLTPKNTQFKEPKFCFSGACAGCGETSYIKLLTQLFGESMIIANATGCSSIYGGSVPSMPYSIPWASSLFEDNAEYGYGMLIGNNTIKNKISTIMENNLDNPNKELFIKWLNNCDNLEITKYVYNNLDYNSCPDELVVLKDYLIKRSIWTIGGDGWAYDIGYGGIDHVLSSNDDVNILVLDSEVYSNTGGQSSKSSRIGSIASFASSGKKNLKKDLARIALSYPNCYVATINIGANPIQTLKAMKEAENHKGPSILIAYTPCISHGIKDGMECSIEIEKLASLCGYYPLFRYNPSEDKFYLDSKKVDFDLYEQFLDKQTRYSMLKIINTELADNLLKLNKEAAIKRYNYYQKLSNENV